jgi:hypothetical protein
VVKIDQAFVSAFKAGDFGLPIAYENEQYPAKGSPKGAYAELLMIQNNVTPFSLAHTDETDGIFRVILRYPANGGAIPAKQKAESIANAFRVGRRISYDGVTATVIGSSRVPGVPEDGWYKQVLSFQYRSFITR